MATAGSVVVNLIANTQSFQKGLKRSRMDLDTFKRTVKGSQDAIRSVGKELTFGFVGAIAVAGSAITGLIQRNADLADSFVITGDQSVKYAQALGLAIGDLQGLQYAAEQMGSSAESLDKSLTRMIANIGDFSQGTGEAKQPFLDLGLSAEKLINMTPDKAFLAIADSIKEIKNPTIAAASSYEIFGRRGIELVNTLKIGSEGIKEFGKEAEALGGIMTLSVADTIAKAKGEIDKFTLAQRGFGQAKGAAWGGFNPVRSAKQWWSTSGPTRKFYDMLNKDMSGISGQAKATAVTIGTLAESIEKMNESVEDAASTKGVKHFYDMLSDLRDQAAGVDDMTRALIRMDAEVGFSAEQYKELIGVITQINALKDQIDAQNKPLEKPDKPDTFSFTPSAREIDTSKVSIAGLAMSGKETILTETKKQTQVLDEINYNTRRMAGQEMLN